MSVSGRVSIKPGREGFLRFVDKNKAHIANSFAFRLHVALYLFHRQPEEL